jgi:putative component of membrane protein insertase Oxa1/YidC/SpoIIIJ protein YidD
MVTNAPSIAEKSCHMVLQIYYHMLSPLRRTEVTFRTATTSGYLLARIQQAYGASIK